jgi:predicted ABC-type ATPase
MIFLWLPNVGMAIERVKERSRQGGHDVPEPVIRRRYEAGWKNFNLAYKRIVDYWFLYDDSDRLPRLLEKGIKA